MEVLMLMKIYTQLCNMQYESMVLNVQYVISNNLLCVKLTSSHAVISMYMYEKGVQKKKKKVDSS